MSEPKVTECWTEETREGYPHQDTDAGESEWNRRAILLWREDFDAMRKELEELREHKNWHELYKAMLEVKVDKEAS